MNVLMTGGYGCIGSWVTMQLIKAGHNVAILDLKRDTHRLELLLEPEQLERIRFIPGDVTDAELLQDAARQFNATQLLHLAALQVPLCRANPIKGAMVNVVGTLSVFETAKVLKDRISRVVYASSAAVHGPGEPDGAPLADEVRLSPMTHYGAFKVCNELNAKVYWLDHGITSVALRPWTVYGVGRDFGMTSEPTKAIKAVAAGRDYAISYGGLQDLQYVGDVAAAFVRALDAPFEGADAFNVRGDVVPIETFVSTFEAVVPEAKGRVSHASSQLPIAPSLDDARLQEKLGPLTRTTLDQGIAETYRRFSELRSQGRLDLSDL